MKLRTSKDFVNSNSPFDHEGAIALPEFDE
jgi:hypothetical protein